MSAISSNSISVGAPSVATAPFGGDHPAKKTLSTVAFQAITASQHVWSHVNEKLEDIPVKLGASECRLIGDVSTLHEIALGALYAMNCPTIGEAAGYANSEVSEVNLLLHTLKKTVGVPNAVVAATEKVHTALMTAQDELKNP